jgi:outer membrane lipoprotein-sorting protein
MVSIRSAFAFALISLANPAPAAPQPVSAPELAAYEKGFTAVQQATSSFRSDLHQVLHLDGIAQPISSTGTLYYQSPDRLLIRFSQPAGEWMLVNGTQAAIQKQGKPLQRRDLGSQGKAGSHAANLLDFFHSDAARWHRDFDVSMTREGDHLLVRLKPWMTPTSNSQGVEMIVTTLKLPGYDILGMEVTINQGNRIEYQFLNGQRNAPVDSSLFKIPAPSAP